MKSQTFQVFWCNKTQKGKIIYRVNKLSYLNPSLIIILIYRNLGSRYLGLVVKFVSKFECQPNLKFKSPMDSILAWLNSKCANQMSWIIFLPLFFCRHFKTVRFDMTTRRHDDKGEKNQKSLFDVVGRVQYS